MNAYFPPRSISFSALLGCFAILVVAIPALGEEKAAVLEKAVLGKIERFDPRFDEIVPKDAVIERLAEGFDWLEGPLWSKQGKYLLFSDIPKNQIVKYDPATNKTSVFLQPSGYTGEAPFTGPEPGTNGLTFDAKGNLVMCCHGDRCIVRLALGKADAKRETLVDRYEGKRLNSPNDLVYHSNGDLYFTDPPYGLPQRFEDPARELDWCGVYRLSTDGKLTLLTKELDRPNGIAFSPDEKTLYVSQSEPTAAKWTAFPVADDGTLGKGKKLNDVTKLMGKLPGSPDGMKVDKQGVLFCTGPGGVYVLTPNGELLGRLFTGQRTGNCAWGDDGSSLYIMAHMYLAKIRLNTVGVGF